MTPNFFKGFNIEYTKLQQGWIIYIVHVHIPLIIFSKWLNLYLNVYKSYPKGCLQKYLNTFLATGQIFLMNATLFCIIIDTTGVEKNDDQNTSTARRYTHGTFTCTIKPAMSLN